MEPLTLLLVIGGAAALIGLGWLMGRLFLRLLKHLLIALLIGVVLMLIWYQPFCGPPRDPNLGKHAYAAGTGQYLGVVVGSAKDAKLGEVWIVQPPSGYKTMYRKSRLVLKDK
jgi:hypothetical protein